MRQVLDIILVFKFFEVGISNGIPRIVSRANANDLICGLLHFCEAFGEGIGFLEAFDGQLSPVVIGCLFPVLNHEGSLLMRFFFMFDLSFEEFKDELGVVDGTIAFSSIFELLIGLEYFG